MSTETNPTIIEDLLKIKEAQKRAIEFTKSVSLKVRLKASEIDKPEIKTQAE